MSWIQPVSSVCRAVCETPKNASAQADSFKQTLEIALAPKTTEPVRQVTVQRGDTLGHLVLQEMKATGEIVSGAALYRRVNEIAELNGIDNPNLIFPGQKIALTQEVPRHELPVSTADVSLEPVHFASPVNGIKTSGFGNRLHPILLREHFHQGIDLAAPEGTPVQAAAGGTVIEAGWKGGYGKTVVIEHAGGHRTLYAHLSKLAVSAGQRIKQQQMIGKVGSTGRATGPHLHFEIHQQGRPINPHSYLFGNISIAQNAHNNRFTDSGSESV